MHQIRLRFVLCGSPTPSVHPRRSPRKSVCLQLAACRSDYEAGNTRDERKCGVRVRNTTLATFDNRLPKRVRVGRKRVGMGVENDSGSGSGSGSGNGNGEQEWGWETSSGRGSVTGRKGGRRGTLVVPFSFFACSFIPFSFPILIGRKSKEGAPPSAPSISAPPQISHRAPPQVTNHRKSTWIVNVLTSGSQ